nr:ribonuclease H-like domain-containing protein [Tanacetum cinerariifolium]
LKKISKRTKSDQNGTKTRSVAKPGKDITLSRYKARLVANDSTQLEGVDVDETFSLVVKPGTIRIVLSLTTSRHWPIRQLDIKNAFLHVAMTPLYLSTDMGHVLLFLLLYVDDIFLTAPSETLLEQVISLLHQEFMTDLGSLNYFLGIYVTRDSIGMFDSQHKYAVEILERAHMVNCNSSRTPIDTKSKPGDDGDSVSDPTLYRSLAGSRQYLTFTRLDISYAVQQVCLYMHDSREPHFSALKRILRYVRGTLDHELQLFASSTTSLVAYSYADWAGCLLLGDRLQVTVSFLATTYSLGPLSVNRRFLVLAYMQSIVVLPLLLLRHVG